MLVFYGMHTVETQVLDSVSQLTIHSEWKFLEVRWMLMKPICSLFFCSMENRIIRMKEFRYLRKKSISYCQITQKQSSTCWAESWGANFYEVNAEFYKASRAIFAQIMETYVIITLAIEDSILCVRHAKSGTGLERRNRMRGGSKGLLSRISLHLQTELYIW